MGLALTPIQNIAIGLPACSSSKAGWRPLLLSRGICQSKPLYLAELHSRESEGLSLASGLGRCQAPLVTLAVPPEVGFLETVLRLAVLLCGFVNRASLEERLSESGNQSEPSLSGEGDRDRDRDRDGYGDGDGDGERER